MQPKDLEPIINREIEEISMAQKRRNASNNKIKLGFKIGAAVIGAALLGYLIYDGYNAYLHNKDTTGKEGTIEYNGPFLDNEYRP